MTKYEYLAKLERLLSSLPEQERRDAMNYYEEYFVSAGPDKEAEAIHDLGTPEQAARKILEGEGAAPSGTGAPAYTQSSAAEPPVARRKIPTVVLVVAGVVVGLIVLVLLLSLLVGTVFGRTATTTAVAQAPGNTISGEAPSGNTTPVLPQPTSPASGSAATGETGAVTGTATDWQTSLGSDLRKLDLDLNNGTLSVVVDPTATEFLLSVSGLDQTNMRTRTDDGGLKVQLGPQGRQQGQIFTATLTIPDTGALQELDLSLNASDLDLPDMTIDELDISLNAGDVSLGAINGRSVSLETNAGQITAAVCVADEISLETNAGSIEVAQLQPGRELDVSTNAGNVTAALTGLADSYRLEAEVVAGNLNYDGVNYSSLMQELRQGNGLVSIEVECAAGQIDLSFLG